MNDLTWNEQATAFMRTLEWPVTMCDAGRMMAAWQRSQLLRDETIERVAQVLNTVGWTCADGAHEPGQLDTCTDCRRICHELARSAISAAVGPIAAD